MSQQARPRCSAWIGKPHSVNARAAAVSGTLWTRITILQLSYLASIFFLLSVVAYSGPLSGDGFAAGQGNLFAQLSFTLLFVLTTFARIPG